jgi:hypothetical protein
MNEVLSHGGRGPRSLWRLLPLVAILALGLVAMGANAASAAKPAVPFKASVSGSLSPTGPATLALAGTGSASHLGRLKSYTANVVITSGTVGVTDVTDTLTETLTAVNGDTLTLFCTQTATLSAGVYHGVDHWTVIGGTGRFSGATGSGTGDTYVYLSSSTFTKAMTGSITY